MRKLNMNRVFKKLIIVFLLGNLLSACAGSDRPYNILPTPGTSPGPVVPPPQNPPPSLGQCAVKILSPKIKVKGKGEPIPDIPGHDAGEPDGQFSSSEATLPDIPLRFNATEVKMNAADFPVDARFQISVANILIKMVDGVNGTGTYDPAQKTVTISGVQFEITENQFLGGRSVLPPIDLTTGAITIEGAYGADHDEGSPINPADKKITLVGGFRIPESFGGSSRLAAPFRNGVMLVSISGELERIPDGSPCVDGGSGVRVVGLQREGEQEREVALAASNTIDIGSVFVPQAGMDTVNPGDIRFIKSKRFRLKNGSAQTVSGDFQNQQGFTFEPAGAFTIEPNQSKDFMVTYSAAPASDYSERNVPRERNVSVASSVGGTSISFSALAKRAASEMKVVGTDESATSSITLGVAPAITFGRGNSVRLNCSNRSRVVSISKNVTIENNGIRPLEITGIPHPVDSARQTADPGCISYGREFHRLSLLTEEGATCERQTEAGSTGFTGRCTIPPGNGKVKFKVLYYPMNASSVRNGQGENLENDRATLSIENNDPRFASSNRKFDINLLAAVSPDRSDVIRANIEGSSREMQAGKNLRINIPDETSTFAEKNITIKNNSEDALTNVRISLGESENFSILNPTAIPGSIPGGTQAAQFIPGQISFRVRYTKDSNPEIRSHSTVLTVSYGAGSGENQSRVVFNLVGTVNHQAPTGRWNIEVDNISAYLNSQELRTSPLESEDFREGRNANISSGPLQLLFEPWDDQHLNLRKVTIISPFDLHADDPDLLTKVRNLTPEQRRQMFKLYSTRMTRGVGVPDTRVNGNVVCNEPTSISAPHPGGNVTDLCAYFYYVLENGKKPDGSILYGIYDDETGDLILPDLNVTMVVPFHNNVARYTTDMLSVMPFKASASTLVFDSVRARSFAGVEDYDLVFPPINTGSNFFLPDRLDGSPLLSLEQFACPGGAAWRPTDEAKPKFGCYVTQNSPHYMRGISATPIANGQYSIVVSMINSYGPENSTYLGQPQNVPFFMAGATMWTGIQGRLVPVE